MTRIASQLHARLRLSFEFSHGRLCDRSRGDRHESLQSIIRIEREAAKCQPIELILRPPHGCHGNLRGTDLLRETKAQGHLIPGLEGSFRADPRAPNRKIIDQSHIDDRLSQPASRPDRRESTSKRRVDSNSWVASKAIQGRRSTPVQPYGVSLHTATLQQGWMDRKMISKKVQWAQKVDGHPAPAMSGRTDQTRAG
jgi:hypothetical protein